MNPPDQRDPVEALAEEFLARRRAGERVAVEEYADAHPELADAIRDLFPTIAALEELGVDDPAPGPPPSHPHRVANFRYEGPERLGDLRLVRELGRGGMGVVYEAVQESLGRRVAVKVLPGGALSNPRIVERFGREARTAAGLQHPHIVPLFGVGEQEGLHYLVMQVVEGVGLDVLIGHLAAVSSTAAGGVSESRVTGGPLVDALASALVRDAFAAPSTGPLTGLRGGGSPASGATHAAHNAATVAFRQDETPSPASSIEIQTLGATAPTRDNVTPGYWPAIARIVADAADALAYAHQAGTLHRDVKPGNLLLDGRGHVWVTDFGVAKAVDGLADDNTLSQTGELVGTLRYMAPEQLRGEAGPRSDLYSLGLTLYELATWRSAFGHAKPSEMLRRVLQESPPPPRRVTAAVPRDLETIILKAIAREPDDRYASGDAMSADLRRFAAGGAIAARRESAATRAARWLMRNPVVAGLSAAVLLLGGTTTAMLLTGGPPPRDRPAASERPADNPPPEPQSEWRGPPPREPGPRRPPRDQAPFDRGPDFDRGFEPPPRRGPPPRFREGPPGEGRPGFGPPPRWRRGDDRFFPGPPPPPDGAPTDGPPPVQSAASSSGSSGDSSDNRANALLAASALAPQEPSSTTRL